MTSTAASASGRYELSGNGGQAWLLPVIGAASAAAAGHAYAWVNVYSPVAGYVSVLFSLALAYGAAWPVALAAQKLKVRNLTTLRLAGVGTGLLALYFAWVSFAWVLLYRFAEPPEFLEIARSPAQLWEFVQAINAEGWYSLSGDLRPSGLVLWAFWAIEAAIIVGFTATLSTRRVDGRAFCEDCGRWMQDEEAIAMPDAQGKLARAVAADGLAGIDAVDHPRRAATSWLVVSRQRCRGCSAAAVYRVDAVQHNKTDKGVKTTTTPVQPLHWQDAGATAEIARVDQLLAAAAAAPATPTAGDAAEADATR